MLLADFAQTSEGKLTIVGGGWNITAPPYGPTAVAVHIQVPWDQTNRQHSWRLELIDSDGVPVTIAGPLGEQPVVLEGQFEVGRPVGVQPGTDIGVPIAANIGALPLTPGGRYEWRLSINGDTNDHWRAAFAAAPAPPGQPAPEAPA
jgi:hypothetical protein